MVSRSFLNDVLRVRFLHVLISLLSLLHFTTGQSPSFVTTTNADGQTVDLLEDREPALYTGSFGDCLGGSLLDITRFNAAYYQDNMTITFELEGSSALSGLSMMVYIGVYAYGESRFNRVLNPCGLGINGLCPTNSSVPVELQGIIPVSASDVAGIPAIALSIPDFEGQALLRLFSNETQSEIGCYSAVVTNGNSFSHPSVVGTIVGVFTIAALVSSFATAIYGDHIPTTRTHYAHSMSIFVIFAVYHHIFFTGALSMNWPSVLPAFWSNFAWAAGMIYTPSMMSSINNLLGVNVGNTSVVGAANLGASSDGTAGGYQLNQIFKRVSDATFGRQPMLFSEMMEMMDATAEGPSRMLRRDVAKRSFENASSGFTWYGNPVQPGLPLPGNYSGFAGTLSAVGIPAGNAFMTGFLWLLITLFVVVSAVVVFKWILEGLMAVRWVREDRLQFFRRHWTGFAAMAAGRTLFIAFFMMMFLTMFQFVYKGSAAITAIAAIFFVVFLVGSLGIAILACYYRLRSGHFEVEKGKIRGLKRSSNLFSYPRIRFINHEHRSLGVHEDEEFIKRYGWLSARFKKDKWWFFLFWLVYELVRACFYGGAAGQAMVQVFGLLVVEIIAFAIIIKIKPFEGNRLNTLMVYLLGFSKVATVALSSAFNPAFGIQRIEAAAIGIVIIVIQGFLLIAMIVLIILGAMSTRMSVTRGRDVSPDAEDWASLRTRYFKHLGHTSGQRAPTPAPALELEPQLPKRPHFNLSSVRRVPKIEDVDDQDAQDFDPYGSRISVVEGGASGIMNRTSHANSRPNSMHSTMSHSNLPFGARPHRQSWSSREFSGFYESRRNSAVLSPGNNSFGNLQEMQSDPGLHESYSKRSRTRGSATGKTAPTGFDNRRTRPSTNSMGMTGLERIVTEGDNEDAIEPHAT